MSIQIRRGAAANLTPGQLLAGELAYTTDQKKLYVAGGDGTTKQVVFVEDYANATGAANANKVDHAIAADSAAAGGTLAAQLAALAPLASPALTGNPTAPTPATADNDTSVATTAFVRSVMLAMHPIGTIMFNTSGTNPGSYMGGTWVAWGSGRVPVGVDTSQTEFNTVEKTGGQKTVQSHNHLAVSDGQAFMPSGTTSLQINDHGGDAILVTDCAVGGEWKSGGWGLTGSTGSGSNNMNPYITCFMWKRTA